MVVSLIGPLDNNQVQRVLLVAAYAGITLKVVPITDGVENKSEAYRLNISPLMRVPALKTDEGYLTESHAMIRYIARTEVMMTSAFAEASETEKIPHPQYPVPYAMYGHSLAESAEVDAWLDFSREKLDSLVILFANQERAKSSSSNSSSASGFYIGDYRKPSENDKTQLFRHLTALENRIQYLKDTRKALVQQSGGSITARNYLEEELQMYYDPDESAVSASLAAAKKDTRVSSVYNVAGAIRSRMDEETKVETERKLQEIKKVADDLLLERESRNSAEPSALSIDLSRVSTVRKGGAIGASVSPRESGIVSPRMSMLVSARGTMGALYPKSARGDSTIGNRERSVIQRQDLLFLVGDSLTAADLALAMALQALYQTSALRSEAVSQFRQVYSYYKSIMMLPVAADMRKALKINLA